jgi:hypothetical protein
MTVSPPAQGVAGLIWRDGVPEKPWSLEWFIAETTYGDRVCLVALPDEWAYDFKTADDTYIKRDKIKRWMQFPDSQSIAPTPPSSEPVAFVPIHPRNGPLWSDTLPADSEVERSNHYERMALYAHPQPAGAGEREALRKLVDVVWNEATESTAVPSTKWADKRIDKVFPAATSLSPVRSGLEEAQKALDAVAEFMRKDIQSGYSDLWTPEYEAIHDQVIVARERLRAALTGGGK